MYLETLNTLLRVIKRKKHLYLFFHFLILSCLAFGLSKINIVDYKKIDENTLALNPIMDLPKSFFHDSESNYYVNHPILYFKLIIDENDNLEIIFEGDKKMKLEDVFSFIVDESIYHHEYAYRIIISIEANKNLKLKHLKAFEAEIYSAGLRRVRYNVVDRNIKRDRFQSIGFNKFINELALDFKEKSNILERPPPPPAPLMDFSKFNTIIKVEIDDVIKFNDDTIDAEQLVKTFQNKMDINTLFEYYLNPDATYQNYINVLSAHNKAKYNLMQNKAGFDISLPKYYYRKEERDKLRELYQEFPISIKEIKKPNPKKP